MLRRAEIVAEFGPTPVVSWEKIVEHIDHAVKLVGPNHVGLGSDFDGATMPSGMDDVTQLPRITEALLRRNYSERDVRKILGEKHTAAGLRCCACRGRSSARAQSPPLTAVIVFSQSRRTHAIRSFV